MGFGAEGSRSNSCTLPQDNSGSQIHQQQGLRIGVIITGDDDRDLLSPRRSWLRLAEKRGEKTNAIRLDAPTVDSAGAAGTKLE